MSELFAPLLFLHVLGAIVALGPAFAFPVIGSMAAREPRYGPFAARLNHVLESRLVQPFILSTAVTGAGLIWARSIPVFSPAYRWLLVSLVVYVIALAVSWFVQRPTMARIVELTSGPMPTPGPGTPPAGPPPELAAALARTRRTGMVLTGLSLLLVFLMVVKPALGS